MRASYGTVPAPSDRKPLRVLFVEDRPDDAALLLIELRRVGFAVEHERVETAETMKAALEQKKRWDVVISDFSLPSFDALGALAVLHASGQDVPLIVASGTIGEEAAIESLRAGARDFIVKDRLARLGPAVQRELREAKSRALLRQTEQQLLHAQKLEAVGRLAAGVAHDFNNVLAVIMLNAQMLVDGVRDGNAVVADAEDILDAAKRAADLTRQLLAFGRQQVFQLKVVDLNEVVRNVEKMLRRLMAEDVEMVVLPGEDLGKIEIDVGQIEQVIMNLAVNARDAIVKGGKLVIETTNVELTTEYANAHVDVEPGSYVMLAMSDNGTGMDKETLARIFEPFFTTKEVGRGTGLGLSTVFGIVRQSGGHVFVYSEPGVGTTFRVYFPRTDRPLTMQAPPLPAAELTGTNTILLVEDENAVRAAVATVLTRYGYVVLRAADGEQALALCEQHKDTIDLLITDVVMPRVGGREVMERARRILPDLKVLFVSGYTNAAVVQNGDVDHGVAFLPKPFTPEALLRKVREVLE